MTRIYLFSLRLLILFGLADCAFAGISAQEDSASYPFATRDTLETITVTSKLYWYDIDNHLHTAGDSSRKMIYYHTEEKALIYTDMSDLFSENTLWYSYNLGENGRPAYISAINRYPHQTQFFYNAIPMNESIHGMFNTQFLSVNNTYMVESDLLSSFENGAKLNMTSHSRHTIAAWSRILYKEGTYYGFSDLDIGFVKPITQNLAFNLGGFNKTYDGSSTDNYHQGSNYRGEVTWQYHPNLYMRGQFFLNRSQVGMTPAIRELDIQLPRHSESRNDYFIDITWLPDDSSHQRLHVTSFYTYTDRKFYDKASDYKIKNYYRRYGLGANYNFIFDRADLLVGGTIQIPAGWGSAMAEPYFRYYATCINAYSALTLPVTRLIEMKPSLRLNYQKDEVIHWSPALQVDFNVHKDHLIRLSAASYPRFPYLNERFFLKDSLSGNPDLIPERHHAFLSAYTYRPIWRSYIKIQAGYHQIQNEINYQKFTFNNNENRDFIFIGPEAGFSFWKFSFRMGGHQLIADKKITAKNSIWGRAHYHDLWLKGAVIMDAYGTVNYFGEHAKLMYEPRMDRFYTADGTLPSYVLFNWKVVATVKDAQIFVEMKNALSEQYQVIYGYYEYYWKFHFGVNWIFWD
jgi:hypothetical protein